MRNLLPAFLRHNFSRLTKTECLLLEANIFIQISAEYLETLKNQYRNYVKLLKNESDKEGKVVEVNFLRFVVNDILSTNEYTLEGIANVTHIPLDIILEIASGLNTNPSLMLAAKIIQLHSDVRRELYSDLFKKIIDNTMQENLVDASA